MRGVVMDSLDAMATTSVGIDAFDLPYGLVKKLNVKLSVANRNRTDYNDVRSPELGSDLHVAAALGNHRAVEEILNMIHQRFGSEAKMMATNSRNFAGHAPLHLAARSGSSDVIGRLIAAGAIVNLAGDRGETPLHEAASAPGTHRCLEVAWRLVDAGAAVNQVDHVLDAPLHVAAHCGFLSLCSLLVQRLADVNAVNRSCHSPLDVAMAAQRHETVWRLREMQQLKAGMPLADSRFWEAQSWRVAFGSKHQHLAWSPPDRFGWSVAHLPPGDALASKIRTFFSQHSEARYMTGHVRLLRHSGWLQSFEAMLSRMTGDVPQPMSDDPNLQAFWDALQGTPAEIPDKADGYKEFSRSAFKSTGRSCHDEKYCTSLDGTRVWADVRCKQDSAEAKFHKHCRELPEIFERTTIGFENMHMALVWQGAGASEELWHCLESPMPAHRDALGSVPHIHVTTSVDFAEGCQRRPLFLGTDEKPSKDDDSGTVFLFVLASRFIFPFSQHRTFHRYFDPQLDVHDRKYKHRDQTLPPGFDTHAFGVTMSNSGKPKYHYASSLKSSLADELVAMDSAQLMPIAAIDFCSRLPGDSTSCSHRQTSPRVPAVCPCGHKMISFKNTCTGFGCDGCNKLCVEGLDMLICKECRYQRCVFCFKN